jgi:hypothetical protein
MGPGTLTVSFTSATLLIVPRVEIKNPPSQKAAKSKA